MLTQTPILSLEAGNDKPIYQQIIELFISRIHSGQLKPGTMLPGTRQLSKSLNVHRKTVIEAYEQLTSKGWLYTVANKGTFVADEIPASAEKEFKRLLSAAPVNMKTSFDYTKYAPSAAVEEQQKQQWTVKFDDGFADPRLAPIQELNTAYKSGFYQNIRLRNNDIAQQYPNHIQVLLGMDKILGHSKGLRLEPERCCFIMGIQMALYLVAQTLLQKGDAVIVENPGNPLAWEIWQRSGADLMPVTVDEQGIVTEEIETICSHKKVKAVYVSPHNQYPTTVTLSSERRAQLLDLAKKYHFAIVEADYDYEFWYRDSISSPLVANDPEGSVIYLTCLSNMLPPLSWISCVVGPAPFMQSLRALWASLDHQGDAALEHAIVALMKEGILVRYGRKSANIYKTKRDAVATALESYLGDKIVFTKPAGGLAYWLQFKSGVDTNELIEKLKQRQVLLPDPRQYVFNHREPNALRFGFGSLDIDKIQAGIQAIAGALGVCIAFMSCLVLN